MLLHGVLPLLSLLQYFGLVLFIFVTEIYHETLFKYEFSLYIFDIFYSPFSKFKVFYIYFSMLVRRKNGRYIRRSAEKTSYSSFLGPGQIKLLCPIQNEKREKNIEEISSLCIHNPVALHHKYGSLMDLLILLLPATGKIEAKYTRKKRISHQLLILFIVWFN